MNAFDVLMDGMSAEDHAYVEKKTRETRETVMLDSLRSLREDLEMTQKQLAEATGLHQGNISRLEKGQEDIKLSTLQSYVSGLGGSLSLVINIGDQQFLLSPLRGSPTPTESVLFTSEGNTVVLPSRPEDTLFQTVFGDRRQVEKAKPAAKKAATAARAR
jgi:transcriptional regulator with XRE-family HTH domain